MHHRRVLRYWRRNTPRRRGLAPAMLTRAASTGLSVETRAPRWTRALSEIVRCRYEVGTTELVSSTTVAVRGLAAGEEVEVLNVTLSAYSDSRMKISPDIDHPCVGMLIAVPPRPAPRVLLRPGDREDGEHASRQEHPCRTTSRHRRTARDRGAHLNTGARTIRGKSGITAHVVEHDGDPHSCPRPAGRHR